MPFYAVAAGIKPGIYNTWDECKAQVNGFKNARYKKFNSMEEAKQFCQDNNNNNKSKGGNEINRNIQDVQPTVIQRKAISVSRSTTTSLSTRPASKRKFDEINNKPSTSSVRSVSTTCVLAKSSFTAAGTRADYSNTVIVYTDGACVANGKKGAKAGIGVYWEDEHPDNVSEPLTGRQTNNRAEIQAVVTAIRKAKSRGLKSVTIRTDSKFLLSSITSWVHKWLKNNWTLSTGEPVKNKEDFQDLIEAMQGIEVLWEKVRAHCGVHGNEKADQLAREGALKRARLQ